MKQSDIISFAIHGVQRDLDDSREHVRVMEKVLQELQALDDPTEPVAFVPDCTRCRQDPCICVRI